MVEVPMTTDARLTVLKRAGLRLNVGDVAIRRPQVTAEISIGNTTDKSRETVRHTRTASEKPGFDCHGDFENGYFTVAYEIRSHDPRTIRIIACLDKYECVPNGKSTSNESVLADKAMIIAIAYVLNEEGLDVAGPEEFVGLVDAIGGMQRKLGNYTLSRGESPHDQTIFERLRLQRQKI